MTSRGFQQGLAVSGAAGFLLIGVLYTLLAPTDDVRARIPFLVSGFAGILTVTLIFAALGTLTLFAMRLLRRESAAGAALAAIVCTLLLVSGALGQIVPTFERRILAVGVAAVIAGSCAFIIAREKRRGVPGEPKV